MARRWIVVLCGLVGALAVAGFALGWWPEDPSAVGDQVEPPVEPGPSPAPSAASAPAPTPSPSATSSQDASEPVAAGSEPPSVPLLEELRAPRLVVEHADGVWLQLEGGPWRLLGSAEEVHVAGDGRWWYEWTAPTPVLRSVADRDVTCDAPDGFFDVERDTAVIHEDGLTSVFVAAKDGTVNSVVCEDPGRTSPIDWSPPDDLGDGEFGPFLHVEDGITLVVYGDAEGNSTVYDETGEQRLIDYAISGPMVDAARGLLVYVAQEGGMHFAGGTLVVTDLGGDELHRVDLGGTSHLSGLVDGLAVVERVQLPEFTTTHHVVVDVTTGMVVDEAAATVGVRYVGP